MCDFFHGFLPKAWKILFHVYFFQANTHIKGTFSICLAQVCFSIILYTHNSCNSVSTSLFFFLYQVIYGITLTSFTSNIIINSVLQVKYKYKLGILCVTKQHLQQLLYIIDWGLERIQSTSDQLWDTTSNSKTDIRGWNGSNSFTWSKVKSGSFLCVYMM